MPKNMKSDATFASVNVRERKSRRRSIGELVRSSQATKAAISSAPIASEPRISGLVHPWLFPRMTAQTIAKRPVLTSASPGRSRRPAGPCDSSSRLSASGISASPIGTLSQNTHCHEIPSTTAPPTTGPNAIASPPTPPQIPSASPRRFAGTAALNSVSVSGVTIAPPMPWIARARFSASIEGASAANAEPRVKIDKPDDEHASPAEAVSERGPGEQEHGEGQRVGVDRPFELLDGRVEIGTQDGDRGGDHEVVQRDHEERYRGDDERPDHRSVACHVSLLHQVVTSYSFRIAKKGV